MLSRAIMLTVLGIAVAGCGGNQKPQRSAARGVEPLHSELDSIAAHFHGTMGYSLHHLRTGDRIERLGSEQFPTASTIKVAILLAAMEKVQRGEIVYDDSRPLTEQDRQYGTGLLHNYRAGTRVTMRDLLDLMITRSDNTGAIMVGQWIGTAAINGWLDRHGLHQTRLLVPFPYQGSFGEAQAKGGKEWEMLSEWGIGVTTPDEMRELMEMVLDGRACTPAECDEIQRILSHQYYDDGIASQVPPWVSVASKHGSEDSTRSDVAIVHSPSGDYVLAIYTKGAKDIGVKWDNEQDMAIRAISRAVWHHYHPRIEWTPAPGSEKFFLFQTEPCYPGMTCWTAKKQ